MFLLDLVGILLCNRSSNGLCYKSVLCWQQINCFLELQTVNHKFNFQISTDDIFYSTFVYIGTFFMLTIFSPLLSVYIAFTFFILKWKRIWKCTNIQYKNSSGIAPLLVFSSFQIPSGSKIPPLLNGTTPLLDDKEMEGKRQLWWKEHLKR